MNWARVEVAVTSDDPQLKRVSPNLECEKKEA
jgi:hypothetical protein